MIGVHQMVVISCLVTINLRSAKLKERIMKICLNKELHVDT